MYMEQLTEHFFELKMQEWESLPINKRGTPPSPPKHPKWTDHLESEEKKKSDEPEIYPDIADLFGTIKTVEIGDIRGQ